MDKGEWNPAVARNLHNSDLSSLLDDKTANKIVQNLKKAIPQETQPYQGKYTGKPVVKSKPQDSDLLCQMAQKLGKVEKICEVQRKELKEKAELIQKQNKEIQMLKTIASPEHVADFQKVEEENQKLKLKIGDMEKFLADYGLKWVGNAPAGTFDMGSLMQDLPGADLLYKYHLPNEIDIAVIERRIQELNMIAEKDAARWVAQGAVHRFKAPESVCITFFKNGLVMQGYPFRPYSSNQAQSLLSDILDGYFPYDLKKKFPDGVPLRSVDKTTEMFKANGGMQGVNDPSLGLLSKDQFLAQLPENVIRNGEVISVREDIAMVFANQKIGTVKVNTHVDAIIAENSDFKEFTTLRIKTETGQRNLIIFMLYNDTLGNLKILLDKNRENKAPYELRSTFPAKVFDFQDKRTLSELELIPNFALALRNIE